MKHVATIGLFVVGVVLTLVGPAAVGQMAGNPEKVQRTTIYTKESVPATPRLEDLPLKESVSQYGITWTFEKPARVGQFVNGDFYVVGAFTIRMIDPRPLFGDEVKEPINKKDVKEDRHKGKLARNGSSLNPVPCPAEGADFCSAGFDSRIPGRGYDPEKFTKLPIAMVPGDALVSSISRTNEEVLKTDCEGSHPDPIRVAAVLSCVAEPQPPDAFRPSYCDARNSKPLLARNLKRELLLRLPRVAGMPERLDGYAARFQKPWLDLADMGFCAPPENLPHYGQLMAEVEGEASLLMLSDYPAEEKESLLLNFVQVGIDLYGCLRGGISPRAWGGIFSGRKWPVVFAGVMLDDEDMRTPARRVPGLIFQEDDQTALGPIAYRGKTFQKSWSGSRAIFMGHTPQFFSWGEKHWDRGWGLVDVYAPSEWPEAYKGSEPASQAYRGSNTSGAWIPTALAVRLMHLEKVWNHDAFFAYVDRWMTEDDTPFVKAMAEAGFRDHTKVPPHVWPRQGWYSSWKNGWVPAMWAKYRNDLPPASDGGKTPNDTETWK